MSQSPLDAARGCAFAVDRERLAWGQAWANSMAVLGELPLGQLARPAPGKARGRRVFVDLVAGNDIALHWLQTPPASVASLKELHLVAQARCAQLHGGTAAGWRIAADWRIDRPFVCAALPQETAALVDACLAASQMVARWHSAWSIVSCSMAGAFPADGWGAMRTAACVMLWHCRAGEVACLASWPSSPAEAGDDAARRALQQMNIEGARTEQAAAGQLHWLDLVGEPGAIAAAARVERVSVVEPHTGLPQTNVPVTEASVALRLSALLAGIER